MTRKRLTETFPWLLPLRQYQRKLFQYQYNKVHNLKLAAAKVDGVIIKPGESFSLCYAIKDADRDEPYLEGLSLVNGKTAGEYGGGLCQLSNLLYWVFLHTPLTITERHGHGTESIPPVDPNELAGIDATIAEGWLRLRGFQSFLRLYQKRRYPLSGS